MRRNGEDLDAELVQACYAEVGCDATAYLCSLAHAHAPPGAPCASDVRLPITSTLRRHFSAFAEGAGCPVDSLAWLAGADRSRAVILLDSLCRNGARFDPADPAVRSLSAILSIDVACR